MAKVVNTGFDTEFGGPLGKFRDFLRSKGIETNIISGVRDDEDQRQLVANRNATLTGRPLPYPDRGKVYVAAPVGSSAHEYGEAADVQPVNPANAAAMHKYAKQFGLEMPNWSGRDPYHVQVANWQQVASTQPAPTPWDQTNPANVPSRMAMNMEGDGPPGTTINTTSFPTDRTQTTPAQRAQFIRNYIQATYPGKDPNLGIGIAGAEGLNAGGLGASTVDIDPRTGQPFSFGDFQMNVRNGLGNVAQRAGFDPTNPNQWQGVDKFAIDTMYGAKQGYNLAPWKGDKFATAYQQSGVVGSPTIAGGAQPSGADAPVAPTASTPTGQQTADNQSLFGRFTQGPIDPATGKPTPGAVTPMAQIADAIINNTKNTQAKVDAAGPERTALSDKPAPLARNVSPMGGAMLPNVAQTYGQTLNSFSRPLSYDASPPQAPQMAAAGFRGGFGPQAQGVSLNSLPPLPMGFPGQIRPLTLDEYGYQGAGYAS